MGKDKKPSFRLKKITADECKEKPALHVLSAMNRRGFLFTGALSFAALMAGCGGGGGSGSSASNSNPGNPATPENPANSRFATSVGAHLGVIDVAFSYDDQFLASSSSTDRQVKLWGVPSNDPLSKYTAISTLISAMAFSPVSAALAAVSGATITIMSVPSGNVLRTIDHSASNPDAIVFSPDGTFIFTGSDDGVIRRWDVVSGALISQFPTGQQNWVNAIDVSSDGTLLASGAAGSNTDYTIKIWDLLSGSLLVTLTDVAWIGKLLFSPDGKYLVSSTAFGFFATVKVWAVATGQLLNEFNSKYVDISFSPDGSLILLTDDRGIEFREVPSGNVLKSIEGVTSGSLAISHDGRLLAVGNKGNGTIKTWDVSTGKFLTNLFDEEATPTSIELTLYSESDGNGNLITYTSPCGDVLPAAAVCTCNCVAGALEPSTGNTGPCSTVLVCTCNAIWI